MKMPYIQFVIGMLDAPQIDYDSKEKEVIKAETEEEELKALSQFGR